MKMIGDVITMSDVLNVVKSVNAVKNFILTHVKHANLLEEVS